MSSKRVQTYTSDNGNQKINVEVVSLVPIESLENGGSAMHGNQQSRRNLR